MPRVTITRAQAFTLAEFVRDHYTSSGDSDREFAIRATVALGFGVSRNAVELARGTFMLPPGKARVQQPKAIKVEQATIEMILSELRALRELWTPTKP